MNKLPIDPKLVPGALLLKAATEPTPQICDRTKLAELLGVTPGAVSHWICGRARPDGGRRVQIEKLLNIPQSAWLTTQESVDLATTPTRSVLADLADLDVHKLERLLALAKGLAATKPADAESLDAEQEKVG